MAQGLKCIFVRSLAEELNLPFIEVDLDPILANTKLAPALSWAAYGQELLRRTHFASQGEGVLVLWREIAWDEQGKMKRKFHLGSKAFLVAEEQVKQCLLDAFETESKKGTP